MSLYTTYEMIIGFYYEQQYILWILGYFYSTLYVKLVIFEAQNLEDKIPSLDCLCYRKKDIFVFEKWATHETHISSAKST